MIRVSREEMARILAKVASRKSKREEKAKTLWPKRGPRKKRSHSVRWGLIKKLDTIFSLYIRARDRKEYGGMCVFGCGRPIECCFHFVTRAKYSVRWDETNAVGSCTIDNYTNEFNPHPYISWYIKKHGLEKYEDLLRRSNILVKRSDTELLEKARDIKARIEVA